MPIIFSFSYKIRVDNVLILMDADVTHLTLQSFVSNSQLDKGVGFTAALLCRLFKNKKWLLANLSIYQQTKHHFTRSQASLALSKATMLKESEVQGGEHYHML